MCVFQLQECQFLPGHTEQRVCWEWLRGTEALPRLLPLPERHGRPAAWFLQSPQAGQAPPVSARRLPTGSLLCPSAGFQFRGASSERRGRPRRGQRGGVHLQDALQRPRHRAEQWATHRQLRFPNDARLLLPDPTDVWQEPQCPDALQLRVLVHASSQASQTHPGFGGPLGKPPLVGQPQQRGDVRCVCNPAQEHPPRRGEHQAPPRYGGLRAQAPVSCFSKFTLGATVTLFPLPPSVWLSSSSFYLSSHWFDTSSRAVTGRSNRHRPGETLMKLKPAVWRRMPRSRPEREKTTMHCLYSVVLSVLLSPHSPL